jgi:hypothetical protein
MLDLDIDANYEDAKKKVRNWQDTSDLENYLDAYREKLGIFQKLLAGLGYVPPSVDAVEEELVRRTNEF